MSEFLSQDFLLSNRTARRLYQEHASSLPIVDFHNHLRAQDVAEDRKFANLWEIWLEGDHYKWRAMRANGIEERYCTGDADPYEKFLAWARTVPYTLRNPLYHWTHLELRRYFGIAELLDEGTAPSIWRRANEALANGLSARAILRKFGVEALCTSDDPADDLIYHRQIAAEALAVKVLPTFRPDKALGVDRAAEFRKWAERLSAAAGIEVASLKGLLDALRQRHDYFHSVGCRLSDHGLEHCYADPCGEREAAIIFDRALAGQPVSSQEREWYASFLMLFFAQLDYEKGWTKQLHLGARRNVNSIAYRELGPDSGFDTVGEYPQVERLSQFLDLLTRENALPQMIVYNLNPADTFALAALIGAFQRESTPGFLQLGSAWWFLDQQQGIAQQMEALSNTGLLRRFIGMVTDSRSFMSFPRHEYFRRILCDMAGKDVERGELPDDEPLLGGLIREVSYENAKLYLKLG